MPRSSRQLPSYWFSNFYGFSVFLRNIDLHRNPYRCLPSSLVLTQVQNLSRNEKENKQIISVRGLAISPNYCRSPIVEESKPVDRNRSIMA